MRKLIFILAILPLAGKTQDNALAKKAIDKKFAVGISASADRCFVHMPASTVAVSNNPTNLPIFGYTTGANFQWKINKRFCLDAGLLYSSKGYKRTYDFSYETPGVVYPTPIAKKANNLFNFTYIDIPVRTQFHFTTGKLGFYALAGVSTNFLIHVKNTSYVEYENGIGVTHTNNEGGYRPVNVGATGGLGLRYNLGNSFIKMEAVYRSSIVTAASYNLHYYLTQAGIDVGYYYTF